MKKLAILLSFFGLTASIYAQVLSDSIVHLQDVEVVGSHFGGLSGGDIKRLQVENNLSSMTGTAAEALRQIPSVFSDIEGGIYFRGSTRSGMLLNGVPYGLLEEYSGDMLIQLPALFFNRINAVSYPPVEWVPDGDAGMINLQAAYTAADSPFQVTLGGGWDERYNAGMVVNLHPGRFHLVGKYNYRREFRERVFRKTTTDKTGTAEMNNSASARPDIHMADLLLGYDLTGNDLISVYGLYYRMEYDRYGGINNTKRNPAGEVMNRVLRHRFNDQLQQAYALEGRWQHRFQRAGDKLDVVFNYNNFSYDEENDFQNENVQTGAIVAQDNLFINQEKHNYYLTGMLRKTFGNDFILKAGFQGRIRKENYRTEANNLKEGNWLPNPQRSYDFDFRRNTYAIYASLQKHWERFGGEAGLISEISDIKIGNQRTGNVEHHPVRFYPRIRLVYTPDEKDELAFTYNQRTIRPLGAELNELGDYSDATHIWVGNPDLKDEIIHSFELNYALNLPRFRLSPAVYYRIRTNRISEWADFNNDQTIWHKSNIGNSRIVGAELTASYSPFSYLSVAISGNIYRDQIDGQLIGYGRSKSMVCGDIKGSVNFHITKDTELQLDGFYLSDQLTPQGKIKERFTLNAGLSQYFMARKLRLNLSINNIFDTLEEVTIIHTDTFRIEQIRNRDARVSWLTLTYML